MIQPKLLGNTPQKRRALRILFGACFAFTALAIFFFSSQSAEVSSQTSGPFSSVLLSLYKGIFGDVAPEDFEAVSSTMTFIVRKMAHFAVYAFLGVSASLFAMTFSLKSRLLIAYLVCVLYAVSDEIHQYFVPGRAMRLYDIAIDSLGVLTGLALAAFAVRMIFAKKAEDTFC